MLINFVASSLKTYENKNEFTYGILLRSSIEWS